MAKEICKEDVNELEFRSQNSFQFDAFIAFAYEDTEYVLDLVNTLEEEYGLSLCIDVRDFVPGMPIVKNILNAVRFSRRTVCFLTKHFLDSAWCMVELKCARMETMYSRKGQTALYLVALEKGIKRRVPLDLMDLVNKKSYMDFHRDKEGTGDTEASIAFTTKLGETLTS